MSQPSYLNHQISQTVFNTSSSSISSVYNTTSNYSSTLISNGSYNTIGWNTGAYNNVVDETKQMTEYMDFAFQILGIDIDFEKFRKVNNGSNSS